MTTKQLLDQISYLRCTIAPNIRQKVKNKRDGTFTTLSDDELRWQITDVIKPVEDLDTDLDSVVLTALPNDEDAIGTDDSTAEERPVGHIAVWKCAFKRQCVGVLVIEKKQQLFRKVCNGYCKISDLIEDVDQWDLKEIIPPNDYCYVESNGTVLLKLLV